MKKIMIINGRLYDTDEGTHAPSPLGRIPTGNYLEFDGGFKFICSMNWPTAKEKREFKTGVSQFNLAVVDGIIFFLVRFGTLNWMDAPFNVHQYRDNRMQMLEEPGPTQGYGLHVMLVDSRTGTLVHQRLIGLEHDLSVRLRDAIIHQPMIPDYEQRRQRVMAQYPTRDLVTLASSQPVSTGQGSMVTTMPQLRPSHRGITGVKKDNYPLPEELRKFNYIYNDGTGHVVMAVPESLLPQAIESGNFDDFECPIPCRYILAKGYRILDGYVICNVPYNNMLGVNIDKSWYDE